jgi:hypothetical protein
VIFLLGGIAWLLISWVVLRANATSLSPWVCWSVSCPSRRHQRSGCSCISAGGWKVWYVIMAVIFLIGAFWGFFRPVNTFFALVSVLG